MLKAPSNDNRPVTAEGQTKLVEYHDNAPRPDAVERVVISQNILTPQASSGAVNYRVKCDATTFAIIFLLSWGGDHFRAFAHRVCRR